jgi:hypothetical protein
VADAKAARWMHGRHWYMKECFGRPEEHADDRCVCPSTCQELCRRASVTAERSPRVEGRRKRRPFTPIPNVILGSWGLEPNEPSDAVRLTYLFLITQTRPGRRWIWKQFANLARERGVSLKVFRQHCAQLAELGLIMTPRMRELSDELRTNGRTVVMLDLPTWFPNPGGDTAEDPDAEDDDGWWDDGEDEDHEADSEDDDEPTEPLDDDDDPERDKAPDADPALSDLDQALKEIKEELEAERAHRSPGIVRRKMVASDLEPSGGSKGRRRA